MAPEWQKQAIESSPAHLHGNRRIEIEGQLYCVLDALNMVLGPHRELARRVLNAGFTPRFAPGIDKWGNRQLPSVYWGMAIPENRLEDWDTFEFSGELGDKPIDLRYATDPHDGPIWRGEEIWVESKASEEAERLDVENPALSIEGKELMLPQGSFYTKSARCLAREVDNLQTIAERAGIAVVTGEGKYDYLDINIVHPVYVDGGIEELHRAIRQYYDGEVIERNRRYESLTAVLDQAKVLLDVRQRAYDELRRQGKYWPLEDIHRGQLKEFTPDRYAQVAFDEAERFVSPVPEEERAQTSTLAKLFPREILKRLPVPLASYIGTVKLHPGVQEVRCELGETRGIKSSYEYELYRPTFGDTYTITFSTTDETFLKLELTRESTMSSRESLIPDGANYACTVWTDLDRLGVADKSSGDFDQEAQVKGLSALAEFTRAYSDFTTRPSSYFDDRSKRLFHDVQKDDVMKFMLVAGIIGSAKRVFPKK